MWAFQSRIGEFLFAKVTEGLMAKSGDQLQLFGNDADVEGALAIFFFCVVGQMALQVKRAAFAAEVRAQLGVFSPDHHFVPLGFTTGNTA